MQMICNFFIKYVDLHRNGCVIGIGTIMTAGTGRTTKVFHKEFDGKDHGGSKQNLASDQYGYEYRHPLKKCTPKNVVYYYHLKNISHI